MDEEEKFFKVFTTINKMLYNRGYYKSELANLSCSQLNKIPRAELTISAEPRPDSYQKHPILVFFPTEDKVGVKPIRIYKGEMLNRNINHCIIIVKKGITSVAKTHISMEVKDPMFIEFFMESELITDITEHEMVPKHELLQPEERKKLLEKYDIKESQLPQIKTFDPQVRYYGFKKRDIIKISRLSETAGIYDDYRTVT